ncbi:ABC transporter substrate-binding protein [Mycoavidus sp. B2-EB]|uniref:ABC transporter substrate-binding protein n=1 Tax=Mycoavidus sp. B2-EB TaxID=2651972 RepID=UPI0016258AB5|nr:ABC transporter substrate-binding protein [Mycoavidus sp. B2-EB]BBO59285.1 dehydrogenase [Mycoavidus sp. B2-EB]
MSDLSQLQNAGRRTVIKVVTAGAAALVSAFVSTPSRASSRQKIIIRDPGGVISQIYENVLYKPFTKATGIEVIGVAAGPEPIAQIQTMVKSKTYQWDMALLSQAAILLLSIDDMYLEKHGLEHDPVISEISPQFRSPYGVGTNVCSTVLAYRTDVFKGRQAPQTWRDIWDVNNFPGRRSLRKHPFDTIEIALIADDVSLNNVYPCDFNRAFDKLNKIKPHVGAWWTNGAQSEHLLKTGEIDMIPVWIPRVQSAIDAGMPVAFSWHQHIYVCDSWAILKGTPNADACRQFIQFASDSKLAKRLPSHPDNIKKGLYSDPLYWSKTQSTAIEHFNQWMLS